MFGIQRNVAAIILLVVGIMLLVMGYQEYDAFTSKLGRAFGRSLSNKVLFMFLLGGICSLLGFLKLLKK